MESNAVELMRMNYAMKSLSLLYPRSLGRHMAVSTQAVVTQQLLSEAGPETPRARPCRVSTADRSVRKGVMACSLEDLLRKVRDILMLKDKPFSLVLEEDGTAVETEEYFQALDGNTVFMVLQKGQKWQPPSEQGTRYQLSLSDKPSKKIDVARITFDLYKLSPKDFIGCLNVKATLYNTYSLSYELHCYRAKRIVKEVLCWILFGMRATGHMLLGTSSYMQQLLDATEEGQPAQAQASSLLQTCLKILP
ncbi:cell death activator CIDE-3 isoform X1 [Fukomys damarensis]|uniref:Lipid transferase CIDEC n=3 Tax=Fukomys damarensis TaxID=885580 RepID=A0A091E6F3_FUKDA|nr:cell death activator CIDE-3 isoform X1 [Fukomys damarensis]KFO38343.1 Cell death activator CIDE-3 [Fukomys damarensis]